MKTNFMDNNDIFFSNSKKKLQRIPDFSIYLASFRVKTRPKIIQDSEIFALKLEDASLAAIFFALIQNFIVQLYCVLSLVGKGCS